MNAKLRHAIEQRQMLEKRFLSVTEQERARMSQDLHDSLCQELTGTASLLKSRARAIEGQSKVAADTLVEAADTVNANARWRVSWHVGFTRSRSPLRDCLLP